MLKKPLLILESCDFIVESKEYDKKDNSLRLTGSFAIFDELNQNGRIYEAKEYLPHLEYLKEKANANRLFGELDHPEKFDVSLQKVSHMVESIWYEDKENKVKGTIKLFNTRSGMDAQAIIEGGGVLSISSRAAGAVNESTKKVTIKRIFTYDLVAEPGFASAQLTRVNEKYGVMDENVSVYEVSDDFINKVAEPDVKNFLNEMIREMNPGMQEPLNETTEYIEHNNKTKDNQMDNNQEFVTKENLKAWSDNIKESFEKLANKVESLAKINENKDVSSVNGEIEKLIKYSSHIAENFNAQEDEVSKLKTYANYLAENLTKVIGYANYLAENIGNDVKELKEHQKKSISFMNYLAENLDNSIQHSDHLAEGMNKVIGYTNYLAENVNKTFDGQEKLVAENKKMVGYANYLAKNVEEGIGYMNYLGENVEKTIDYTNYLGENLDKSIQYAEYVAENALPKIPEESTNENKSEETPVEPINERIENFITKVNKRKTTDNVKQSVLNLLSESNALKFTQLHEADKTKVMNAIVENKCNTEESVLAVWEETLTTPKEARIKTLHEHRPVSLNETWENLSEAEQQAIESKSRFWDLSSNAKIKDFWMRLNLIESSKPKAQPEADEKEKVFNKVNENNKTLNRIDSGYSMDAINETKKMLLQRNLNS